MIARRAQPWLGTMVEIVAEGPDSPSLFAAMGRAFARVAAIHAAMSFQQADSELSRVNREAARGWVPLSPALAEVFAAAMAIAQASDGLFDPSVAAWLVASGHLPAHPDAPQASGPDWRAIELDGQRARFTRPVQVDLSGIAKGYAVDAALAVLREAGVASATVNAGGDLAHFGPTPVTVHLRHPAAPTRALPLLSLRNGAAATSAGYFQPGALRHPHSGEVLCDSGSVTVLAARCMDADALTKVVAAAPARAPAVLARYGAEAILLGAGPAMHGDGQGWRTFATADAA